MTDGSAAEERIAGLVRAECLRVGIWDRDGAVKLLDRSLLVYDGEGMPLNVLETFDALVASKPYLVCDEPRPAAPPVDRRRRGTVRMEAAVSRVRRAPGGSWTSA